MRNHYVKANLILSLALALAPIGAVAAQEAGLAPCPEGQVSGTVVAVDEETGMVTIDTGAGLCTVMVGGDFDHPIVALLDSFFGEVSAENLAAALEATSVWVVCDAAGSCTLASEEDEGAVAATVLSVTDNGDGTFTIELSGGGTATTSDAELAADLSEALDTLAVDWTLEAGTVVDAGDQIASLHEDGLGFGVIVKLFAMADELQELCAEDPLNELCGVTVDELVDEFRSGGMGLLFQKYGRPSMLGVGHVRQALHSEAEAGTTDLTGGAEGICNAREHGGQANGLGEVNCEPTGEGQAQADQDQQPGAGGQGNGHGGGNGGGQGGGNGGGQGGGNGGGQGGGNGGGNGNGDGKGGRP